MDFIFGQLQTIVPSSIRRIPCTQNDARTIVVNESAPCTGRLVGRPRRAGASNRVHFRWQVVPHGRFGPHGETLESLSRRSSVRCCYHCQVIQVTSQQDDRAALRNDESNRNSCVSGFSPGLEHPDVFRRSDTRHLGALCDVSTLPVALVVSDSSGRMR